MRKQIARICSKLTVKIPKDRKSIRDQTFSAYAKSSGCVQIRG